MDEPGAVQSLEIACGQIPAQPQVAVVPPGDDRRDVQILGANEQRHVLQRPVNVQVTGIPAVLRKVGNALEMDSQPRAVIFNTHPAGDGCMLGAALDFIAVFTRWQVQQRPAITDKMVAPSRQPLGQMRLPRLVKQMNTAGQRLAGGTTDEDLQRRGSSSAGEQNTGDDEFHGFMRDNWMLLPLPPEGHKILRAGTGLNNIQP